MPPKGPSSKTVEKQKLKVVEDKTFGLKNKNKSKKVQKQIANLKQTAVSGSNPRKAGVSESELRKQRKLEEKQRIKELEMLFKPVETKKQREEREAAEKAAAEHAGEGAELDSDEVYSSGDDDEDDEMTLEEIIEKERQKIVNGTAVTAESFQKWKELKRMRQENREKEDREAQIMQFRSSGTGMTGKNLFTYNAELFIDDEEAADALIYEHREEEDDGVNAQVGDASLFTDDTLVDGAEAEFKQLRIYDPDLWTEKDPPKQMLAEYLAKNKHEMAIFEKVDCPVEGLALYKAILPHLGNKEFVPSEPSRNKKIAENNASLMVLDYLQSQSS